MNHAAVQAFLERFIALARTDADIAAAALVGSWARGTANDASDVDLVVVVEDLDPWFADADWTALFGAVESIADEDWGLVQSRRVHYLEGLEVEFGFTTAAWAAPPLDPGTARVVADGIRILYDPGGRLAALRVYGAG